MSTPPSSLSPRGNAALTAVLRSALWPAAPAYAVLVAFAWITVTLLFGPLAAGANAGTSLTWIVWWPVLPVVLFLGGRVWCAICPFGTVIDLVQKVSGLGRPVPGWLKRWGVWIIDGLFILITFLDHTVGIVENPRGSGFLLAGIAVSALVMAVLFERRAWCRYVCFLGGLSGNYARAGLLQVRANTDACRTCETKACYRGRPADGALAAVPGCPMFEFPSAVQTSSYCNLCGNCVKACPSGALSVSARPPLVELLGLTRARYPEAALATVIAGIVLVQNATMLTAWPDWLAVLTRLAFGSEALAFSLAFVGFMGAPVALVAGSAWISNRLGGGSGTRDNFTRFAYALIPLDLAGH
ncbi:MAG TPA: 4Fe-4S binding protein, partial [Deinococcales bacterium]|nr:4Fe-4S binding protein [Deinococcales bacterium]